MQKCDWREHSNGMWYLDDYVTFLEMLRSLTIPAKAKLNDFKFTSAPMLDTTADLNAAAINNAISAAVSKDYRLYASNVPEETYQGICDDQVASAEDRINFAQATTDYLHNTDQVFQSDIARNGRFMPQQSTKHQLAYHMFSVLSYFFDCRDGGACQFRWEDWLMGYFGAPDMAENETPGERSEFHQFKFAAESTVVQYCYYDQTWFQICRFMEQNFRNAVASLHYRHFVVDG